MSAALALVSCPTDQAEALAETLVASGIAACVNVLPKMRSIYRWNGEICRDEEALLLIKHRADRFESLRVHVLAHHPYELPEIIAVDLARGHAPYLAWILDTTA